MTRAELFFSSFIGFLIVAFGQPSLAVVLSPFAAAFGYALFWRCVRIFPFPMQRFWRGALWYTIIAMIQLSWMTAYEYQGIYILAVFVALSIWLGLQFGLLTLLIPYNRSISVARGLAIAALWTLFEWGRFHVLCGFSWNLAGLALSVPFAMQSASLFGVLGLSFWVIFVNMLGLRALIKKRGPAYWVWGCAALFPYAFGMIHTTYHDHCCAKQLKDPFTCLLVQTDLLPAEKVPLNGQLKTFISPYRQWKRIFSYVSDHVSSAPNLIVLPEAALPFPGLASIYSQDQIRKDLSEVFGTGRVEGLFSEVEEGREPLLSNADVAQTLANLMNAEVIAGLDYSADSGKHYNSAFHFTPQGSVQTRYDKRVLMPLAEYLPFDWLRPLVASYGIEGFFSPGEKAKLFRGALAMSVSICYEETFPSYVREGCLEGAEMIVSVTNDVWFPRSRLPCQHYEHSRLRAVENGVPLVRACNTGVTAAVDSLGREVGRLSEKGAAALKTEMIPYTYKTLFSKWGNAGVVSLSSLCLINFLCFGRLFKW